MIDVEPFIVESLERLVPLPGRGGMDWGAIERRAGRSRPSRNGRRLLGAVLLTAFVAVVVGAAFAHSLGGFSDWLSGEPGGPAPPPAQQSFRQTIGSWQGFPQGTQLRQLGKTTVDGATYSLNGFRGDGALCLRLSVTGSQSASELACPPLTQLRQSGKPAIAVVAGYGVGRGATPPAGSPLALSGPTPSALVTLGIVADGVQQVEVGYSDGASQQALVRNDSFLAVESKPSAGETVAHIWAVTDGKRVAIPFVVPPTPFAWPKTAPTLTAHGPSSVQRVVHGGTIHWLAHRLPVGAPVPQTVHGIVGADANVIYAREIAPDPGTPERMIVSLLPTPSGAFGGHLLDRREVCAEIVGGRYPGSNCWPADRLFSTAPFSWTATADRNEQYVTLSGLASDQVTRLQLYLGDGESQAVPLHDNGYLTEVPAVDYPARLVAYDANGLVIGVVTLYGDAPPTATRQPVAQPVANARWKTIIDNSAGTVSVAPSSSGGSCYAIAQAPHGSSGGAGDGSLSCPAALAPTAMSLDVDWSSNEPAVSVEAGSRIAAVVVHFKNGGQETVEIVDGVGLAVVPPADLAPGRAFHAVTALTGLDGSGQAIATQEIPSLVGGTGRISAIGRVSVTIGDTRCQLTNASPPLTGYAAGDRVQYLCRQGVLTLIGHRPASRSWADRTALVSGPIARLTPAAIAIEENGAAGQTAPAPTQSCALTRHSPSTRGYEVGEEVQAYCAAGDLTGINRLG